MTCSAGQGGRPRRAHDDEHQGAGNGRNRGVRSREAAPARHGSASLYRRDDRRHHHDLQPGARRPREDLGPSRSHSRAARHAQGRHVVNDCPPPGADGPSARPRRRRGPVEGEHERPSGGGGEVRRPRGGIYVAPGFFLLLRNQHRGRRATVRTDFGTRVALGKIIQQALALVRKETGTN